MLRIKLLLITAVLISCWQCHAAGRYLLANQDIFNLSLAELALLEVDVATRNPIGQIDAPASVTVYTREEIGLMGIETLEQLLNFVVGVQSSRSDQGGLAQGPAFRGRRATNSAQDILVLYDGIRLNDVVSGGTFLQEPHIALDNIKQVEIIRGPGSALYGANAFSGVISLVPERNQKSVEISAGSFQKKEFSLQTALAHPLLNASLFVRHYEDEGQNYDDFYSFFGVRDKTQDPKRQQDVYIHADIGQLKIKLRHSERKYSDFINGGAMANGEQYHSVENDNLRLEYILSRPYSDWLFYAGYSRSHWDQRIGLFPEDPQPAVSPTTGLYWTNGSTQLMVGGNLRDIEQQRAGLDVTMNLHPQHQVSWGVVARQESNGLNPFQSNVNVERLKNNNELIPSDTNQLEQGFYIGGLRFDLLGPEERDVLGIYIQDHWLVAEALSATIGTRYDEYDDFGGNTSLRGGFVYRFADQHRFKFMYGEAFRAPSFSETRQGIASGGIANPDLKAEQVKTTEFKWEFSHPKLMFSSTLFYNDYSDIVEFISVSDVVPGFTALQPQNKGRQQSKGVELEANLYLSQSWNMRAAAMHLLDPLDDQPLADDTLSLSMNWQHSRMNFNLSGFYREQVRFTSTAGEAFFLSDYWLVNSTLSWQLSEGWHVSMMAENLMNEAYSTWSPQAGLETGLPARERSYRLSLTKNF